MTELWCKRFMPVSLLLLFLTGAAHAQGDGMSFFVTSIGLGKGADLGGLAGADKHCQSLATAAGAGSRTWRAYLSLERGANGSPFAVNARDRVGKGPWYNAKGTMIAKDVAQLHAENNLTKETALSESGEVINGYGDSPSRHDILTGSTADGEPYGGRAFTCNGWTKGDDVPPAAALVGHHDRTGHEGSRTARSDRRRENPLSWTFAHPSLGCSQEALRKSGGDGLFYCFAAD
jgi:hypothetical protein